VGAKLETSLAMNAAGRHPTRGLDWSRLDGRRCAGFIRSCTDAELINRSEP